MERPKPIPLDQIDLIALAQEVQDMFEAKLDLLDEGWNPEAECNENEDILDDDDPGILEVLTKTLYGKDKHGEDKYWEYYNTKV